MYFCFLFVLHDSESWTTVSKRGTADHPPLPLRRQVTLGEAEEVLVRIRRVHPKGVGCQSHSTGSVITYALPRRSTRSGPRASRGSGTRFWSERSWIGTPFSRKASSKVEASIGSGGRPDGRDPAGGSGTTERHFESNVTHRGPEGAGACRQARSMKMPETQSLKDAALPSAHLSSHRFMHW